MSRTTLGSCFLTVLILIAAPGSGPASAADSSLVRRHVLSTNPVLDMFEWFNVEYELRATPTLTVGIAGSFISFNNNDEEYKGVQGFLRYYPEAHSPAGFFFGGRLGYFGVELVPDFSTVSESGSFFGAGIDIGYNWLMGAEKRFYLSLGIGAVRLFGNDLEDMSTVLPTIRLVDIGVAF